MVGEESMDIDISALTFRDASKEEKSRIFRVLNLRGTVLLVLAIAAIIAVHTVAAVVLLIVVIAKKNKNNH